MRQESLAEEVQALRRIMATLRPSVLEERGLVSARVGLAGGTWTVWSRPGSGTVLTASLPRALVAA